METETLILTNDDGKRCKHCGRILPTTRFHKSSASRDGLQAWCMECKSSYNAKREIFRKSRRIELSGLTVKSIVWASTDMPKSRLTDCIILLKNAVSLLEKQQEKNLKKK